MTASAPDPRAAAGRASDPVPVVRPGPRPGAYVGPDGRNRVPPAGWALLPPGDATLTRRVKAGGPHWKVEDKKGRRAFSRGVLAEAARIERLRTELAAERDTPAYQRKLAAGRASRAKKQAAYVEDFAAAVRTFLRFAEPFKPLEARLARAVADHATPVGSGTVARTERIPVAERAEAAVIAWLRHQTTAYDRMQIARTKGKRREVRRQLAERSRRLLDGYRRGTGGGGVLEKALG